ncbi:MAG: PTS fructose transporter subunit IIA [Candidatus Binatia bacterium]|nr:MAG: PTS fructose transporter subunit IIA [Candidatus Binatia bacterium]
MRLTDILDPALVLPDLQGKSKDEVLREFAEKIHSVHPEIPPDELVAVLWEREQGGTTAIGDGIAIPHGRLRGVQQIVAAFGRHRKGVDFQSIDGKPTHLIFLLVLPEESVGLHLKALARVSRLLKDPAVRQNLLSASDGAELYEIIRQEDEKL